MNSGDELVGLFYDTGRVVFNEGDAAEVMYLIKSGAIEIRCREGDKDVVLNILGAGEIFGEMALIGDAPRSATAKAFEPSYLIPMNLRELLVGAAADPEMLMDIISVIALRIERANELLHSLKSGREETRAASEASTTHMPGSGEVGSSSRDRSPEGTQHEIPGHGIVFNYSKSACKLFQTNEVIFRQGEQGDRMYFILEGEVEIIHGTGDGERSLAILHPPSFFGEMALITGSPRSATAVARSKTRVLPVARDEFLAKVSSKAELGLFIAQVLSARLRRTVP
ncbi:MAG: cyclic nucleotide-binding domain-containing protein [Pseudomonadota bacterium]